MWTKLLVKTANLKIKVTIKTTKLHQLQTLKHCKIGTNEVEDYARREARRGGGGGRRYQEERRREVVEVLMRGKLRSAMRELEEAKGQFHAATYRRR